MTGSSQLPPHHKPMHMRLPRLPNPMDTANHLKLRCNVRLRLHNDHVRCGGERQTRRVVPCGEKQRLHLDFSDEIAELRNDASPWPNRAAHTPFIAHAVAISLSS